MATYRVSVLRRRALWSAIHFKIRGIMLNSLEGARLRAQRLRKCKEKIDSFLPPRPRDTLQAAC